MIEIDFSRSIIEAKTFFNRTFLIKRDDLIHPYCNGNKARKFLSLLESNKYKVWVSYGGNQSNAMLALAYIANLKGIEFRYVMPYSINPPMGNLLSALNYGMQAYTLPIGSPVALLESYAKSLLTNQALFIHQGGILEFALKGMTALAIELKESVGGSPLIFYTSGSGVGVIALQKALDVHFSSAELVAINCAGSEMSLREKAKLYGVGHMKILHSPFVFAKPKKAIWEMREYLAQNGILFDLIYDSSAFCVIKEHLDKFSQRDIIFIHSGGLTGDISQEQRYISSKII